jgi:hypothetical protein
MMAPSDARRVYELWLKLIADEELYQEMLAGRHAALAASRGLTPEDLTILDQFHERPGTRWDIENLRFRAATEVGAKLKTWMPRTTYLLTLGNEDWLQDTCFEYLAAHRWEELGHLHFTECERFATYTRNRIMKRRRTPPHLGPVLTFYTRNRIMKRRRTPPHLGPVLTFETAVLGLLKGTRGVSPAAWPTRPSTLEASVLAPARPRWGPAVLLIELPVDLTAWIASGDPRVGQVVERPSCVLAYVPSLSEKHRFQTLGEGARLVFELCRGEATSEELASHFAEELGFEREDTFRLLGRWVRDGALVLS